MNNAPAVSEFFDTEAARWSDRYTSDPRFVRRFEKITRMLDRLVSGRALDVGCGSGVFSHYLSTKGWQVLGIDISPEMIEAAGRYASGPNVEFRAVAFEALGEQRDRFDLILSLSMLEYVEDDEAAIQKCSQLLRSGGYLLVSVPNRKGLLRVLESFVFGIRTVTKGKVFGGRGEYLNYQARQYSPLELDLMMRLHGFRKKRGMFLGAGISGPRGLLPVFERRWWATMYCALYEKK